MLDRLEAEIITRADFGRKTSYSPEAASSPSPRVEDSLPMYGFEYDFVDNQQTFDSKADDELASANAHSRKPDFTDGQTFEFRLFPSPAGITPSSAIESKSRRATTVKLLPSQNVSDAPIPEGHFLGSGRRETYYFTSSLATPLLIELRREYAESAVSSEDILQKASLQQWPGTALPWRVIHVSAVDAKSRSDAPSHEFSAMTKLEHEEGRRKKPNKKRRIQLRKLSLARAAAANAKVRQSETVEEKEKALRRKRTAKNRKIQLKRREKERQKKAEAKAAGLGLDGASK